MPEDTTSPAQASGGRWKQRVRSIGPWLLAIALIGWITGRVSWAEAWQAAAQADLATFSAALAVSAIYWFLLDSWGYSFLFSRFNAAVSWQEARSVRALTYLLTPINWNVGTAGVILHLRQSKGVSAVEGTSSMMLYMAADGLVILGLLVVGIALVPDAGPMSAALPWIVAFMSGQIVFFALVMANKPKWSWLERLRAARILQAYRKATAADVTLLIALRVVYFGGFVGFFWLGTRAFGVEVPLGFMAMSMPLIMGSAMFTPAGVGSQQAVMLGLWDAYGTSAAVLAFGVAFPVGLILVRVGIGLLYLGDLREFRRLQRENQELEEAQPAEG